MMLNISIFPYNKKRQHYYDIIIMIFMNKSEICWILVDIRLYRKNILGLYVNILKLHVNEYISE